MDEPVVRSVPVSVTILRQCGPMALRDLTRRTAVCLDTPLEYLDVDAVLRLALERGEVRIKHGAEDFRERVWEAILDG